MRPTRLPGPPVPVTALGVALLALASGCGASGPDGRAAQFSFESGLEGWGIRALEVTQTAGGSAIEIPWSVERTSTRASRGRYSIEFKAANWTDAAKIWIERPFELAPDSAYEYELLFDWFGVLSQADGNRLLAGAVPRAPTTRDEAVALAVDGAGGPARWVTRRVTGRVTTGLDGRAVVVIGFWATFEIEYAYGLDNVRVRFSSPPSPGL